MQALSLGRQARDVLGVAATGSGKTAAFVLPMLLYLQSLPPLTPERIPDGPYALILAPTRELAQQTEAAARSFGAPLGFRVLSIIGGVSIEEQGFALQRGIEIVVATPGRLLDCINSRYMALNQCNYIVLDEADKMIDMGFEGALFSSLVFDTDYQSFLPLASFQYSHQQGDIRLILDSMPATSMKSEDEAVAKQQEADIAAGRLVLRHTTMYSATMPPQVEILARTYLRHPVTVHIGKIAEPITQAVVFVKGDSDRTGKLQRLLADSQPPIIVFVNQKKTVESLGRVLEKQGWACARLHSGRSQEQRTEALESFRQGLIAFLFSCLQNVDNS